MALITPEYLQTQKYSAKRDRLAVSFPVLQEGIVDPGHFAVSQRAAGANMSVDVAAGRAWVKADDPGNKGFYHIENDATVNVALTAANATNPRIDTIVVQVNDSIDGGDASDTPQLLALAGTPTSGATLANLTGAASVPTGALVLAYVLVAANATSIVTANIGGLLNPFLGTSTGAVAGAPPAYAMGRPASYVPMSAASAVSTSVPANSWLTAVPLANESIDNDAMHDTVTNNTRIVAKTPGFYLAQASYVTSLTSAKFGIQITKLGAGNNISSAELQASGTPNNNITVLGFVRLGYGEYLEMNVLNGSAGAVNTATAAPGTGLSAVWVAP